ncbi:MAG: hypothetical protein K8R19_02125 [Methanosarcinales archaeon]|nr:hypothetical protein [Methanosarcinales archaeon]
MIGQHTFGLEAQQEVLALFDGPDKSIIFKPGDIGIGFSDRDVQYGCQVADCEIIQFFFESDFDNVIRGMISGIIYVIIYTIYINKKLTRMLWEANITIQTAP